MRQGRRLIYVGSADDVARMASRNDTQPLPSWDEGESPLAGILAVEIRRIEKWCRMDFEDCFVLEASLLGRSNHDIAVAKHITDKAMATWLYRLRRKVLTYPHRGLLTVLIEECGWEAVSEYLAVQYQEGL